jgi:hypothetical protein
MSSLIQTSFANEDTSYWAKQSDLINLSEAVANLSSEVQNWSQYPATSTINASGYGITNISSLQLDDQVLTALSGELLLNGVPIATIPDISNVEDWALYPALSNIDVSNFAISNVSGFELDGQQISAVGDTLLVNGSNPVSNWWSYNAGGSVNLSGNSITNVSSLQLDGATITTDGLFVYVEGSNGVEQWSTFPATSHLNMSGSNICNVDQLDASGVSCVDAYVNTLYVYTPDNNSAAVVTSTNSGATLLLNSVPLLTSADISSNVGQWATYPAVTNVNMSGFAISNTTSVSISGNVSNVVLTASGTELLVDGQPVYTGPMPPDNASNWATYPANHYINTNGNFITAGSSNDLSLYGVNIQLNPQSNLYVNSFLNMQGNPILNTIGVEICGNTQVIDLTASGTSLLVDGQPVYTGPLPPDNASNWATYSANHYVNMNGNFITAGSSNDLSMYGVNIYLNPQSNLYVNSFLNMQGNPILNTIGVEICGNTQVIDLTASGAQLLVQGQPVFTGPLPPNEDWANYPAIANVDMSGFSIQDASSIYAVNVVVPTITLCSSVTPAASVSVTANDTQMLVNGQPVYTGALPPSDTSNWANYPAVNTINASGKLIYSGMSNDLSLTGHFEMYLNAGCNINLMKSAKTKSIDITQGHINQCNVVGDGTTNKLVAATTFGDVANLGYVEVLGSSRLAGFSSFYVEGGVTFDGGTVHGFKCTSAGAGIFGLARFELTPLLIYIASAGPITIASITYSIISALLNVRVAAGTFVTIEHGNLGGFDGIYLQNTINDPSSTRVIMTAGGTLYNAGVVQSKSFQTSSAVQYWGGVWNPSGGATPTPPLFPGPFADLYISPLTYVDPLRANNLVGQFVRWFPPYGPYQSNANAYTWYTDPSYSVFSNTTLIGKFLPPDGGIASPNWFGNNSVHIGNQSLSGFNNIFNPFNNTPMGDNLVAIGNISGWNGNNTDNNIIIGTHNYGISGQGSNCVSIGSETGRISQGSSAIAIGDSAAGVSQGANAIAMGFVAGSVSQGANAVAIGHFAGEFGQGVRSVAIGNAAGENDQAEDSVAVGTAAGTLSQGIYAVAIGNSAGGSNQGGLSVAIGNNAGSNLQEVNCVAIGNAAGQSTQSQGAIAMGTFAGNSAQGSNAVGIGYEAGSSNQGVGSVAVGRTAGRTGQQNFAVAVGNGAGNSNQEYGSVAIGYAAGFTGLGSNAIVIGNNASAGTATQGSNSILLNATGSNSPAVPSGACYILPMRGRQSSNAYQTSAMLYNSTTGEVTYDSAFYGVTVLATSATPIALDASMRGRIYILTGTTTQVLDTTALTSNDTNFFISIKNGNPTNGGDITISGAAVTNNKIIHEAKPTTNSGILYAVWNGTQLVGY